MSNYSIRSNVTIPISLHPTVTFVYGFSYPLSIDFSIRIADDCYSACSANFFNPIIGVGLTSVRYSKVLIRLTMLFGKSSEIQKRLFCEWTANMSKKSDDSGLV